MSTVEVFKVGDGFVLRFTFANGGAMFTVALTEDDAMEVAKAIAKGVLGITPAQKMPTEEFPS